MGTRLLTEVLFKYLRSCEGGWMQNTMQILREISSAFPEGKLLTMRMLKQSYGIPYTFVRSNACEWGC